MEELPQLVKFKNNDDYYDDYYDYNYYDSDYYKEEVTFLYKLNNGRIVACHRDGTIEILNIKF